MVELLGYKLDGPYKLDSPSIENRSGIYVILGADNSGKLHADDFGQPYVIDVGESAEIRDRIVHHDRRKCWEECKRERGYASLEVALHYDNKVARELFAENIRDRTDPPCGER